MSNNNLTDFAKQYKIAVGNAPYPPLTAEKEV